MSVAAVQSVLCVKYHLWSVVVKVVQLDYTTQSVAKLSTALTDYFSKTLRCSEGNESRLPAPKYFHFVVVQTRRRVPREKNGNFY